MWFEWFDKVLEKFHSESSEYFSYFDERMKKSYREVTGMGLGLFLLLAGVARQRH